ncbi:MAG: EpsG family protein [Clostridia bacterium]|nr:EpsG family protein [Clostridia bacterium]
MILICGLRYNVGTDYQLYTRMYSNIDIKVFSDTEFIFKQIINLLNNFNLNVYVFFFVIATITISLFYIQIKKQSNFPATSLFLFVCLGYYALCFNTIRQTLAIAITLVAFKYIYDRKALKYFLVIIVAGLVHTSAFIMIPIYFINRININKKNLRIIFLIMILGLIAYNPIFEFITLHIDKYNSYSNINGYTFSKAGAGTYVIMIFHIIIVFILIKYKNLIEQINEGNNYYIILATFSLFFYLLSLSNTVAVRPGYYFSIYLVFALPNLFKNIFRNNYNKSMIIVAILFMGYYLIHLISFNSMLPYTFLLLKQ